MLAPNLWSGQTDGKYISLVKWEIVQKSKDKGGLRVGDLLLKNAALLFKWWWIYACEEGILWRKVVNAIHDEDLVLLPDNSMSNIPGPWQEIKRLVREENPVTQAFFQHTKIQLGDGSKVRF